MRAQTYSCIEDDVPRHLPHARHSALKPCSHHAPPHAPQPSYPPTTHLTCQNFASGNVAPDTFSTSRPSYTNATCSGPRSSAYLNHL